MTFSYFANSQSIEKIISVFKAKKVSAVLENCALPFDLRVGSEEDDDKILTKEKLSKKITKLFKSDYFTDMFKKSVVKKTSKKISFTTKSFDKYGELESESTLSFFFKKNLKNKIVLYSIILAG